MAFDQQHASVITETEHLRAEVQRYREAALIAYGAIVARNGDGSANDVLSVLNKYLFPELSAAAEETES